MELSLDCRLFWLLDQLHVTHPILNLANGTIWTWTSNLTGIPLYSIYVGSCIYPSSEINGKLHYILRATYNLCHVWRLSSRAFSDSVIISTYNEILTVAQKTSKVQVMVQLAWWSSHSQVLVWSHGSESVRKTKSLILQTQWSAVVLLMLQRRFEQ